MKTRFMILLAMGMLAMGSPVLAEEVRIGFVNVAQVLQQAPQAAEAKKRLEREFAPRDKRIVAQQKELKKLQERLARDSAVMSDAERRKLERDILTKQREIKRAREEFREDFNLRRNEELGKLQQKIFQAIKALAKEEKFDLLLTDGVVYASDKVDVTAEVQKRLESLK